MDKYPSHNFHVGCTRPIVGRYGIDDSYYVSLDHSYVVVVTVLLCHLQEMFQKVHDIGARVHVILQDLLANLYVLCE